MSTPSFAGRFVWRELTSPDLDEDRVFYTTLFGWSADTMPMNGAHYTMFRLGGKDVGGMMAPMMEGVPSFWMDYITVDDVDAALAQVPELGGSAITPAMDIPGVGRFAVVQDPAGATFSLFRGATPGATDDARPEVHTFCWSQLMSTNLDRVVPFYGALFGWTPVVGDGGMVMFNRGDRTVASGMAAQMGMPSHWLQYVAVEDCDTAFARAKELGAKDYVPPTTIEGMGRFAVLAGPGGAVFALWKDLMTPA